ncbi:MAG: hypothetical protein PVH37_19055, partial [Desulfobacterales bacterium]
KNILFSDTVHLVVYNFIFESGNARITRNNWFLFISKVERFRVQRSGLKNTQRAPIKGGQHLCIIAAFSPNG